MTLELETTSGEIGVVQILALAPMDAALTCSGSKIIFLIELCDVFIRQPDPIAIGWPPPGHSRRLRPNCRDCLNILRGF
jgi:hypothetical protein